MNRKFSQSIKGNENEQTENFSHNNFKVETSASLTLISIYVLALITGALVLMAILHLALLETLIVVSVCGAIVCGWIVLLALTVRHVSGATKAVQIDRHEREHAQLSRDVLYAAESYILFRDPEGNYQFRGTTQVTENRHFPAQIEAPKTPDAKEVILQMWDHGSAAREIERWINQSKAKEDKVSYHQIQKTLNLYRPGWQERSKKVSGSEEYPVDE